MRGRSPVAGSVTLLSNDFTSDSYKIALTTIVAGILNE